MAHIRLDNVLMPEGLQAHALKARGRSLAGGGGDPPATRSSTGRGRTPARQLAVLTNEPRRRATCRSSTVFPIARMTNLPALRWRRHQGRAARVAGRRDGHRGRPACREGPEGSPLAGAPRARRLRSPARRAGRGRESDRRPARPLRRVDGPREEHSRRREEAGTAAKLPSGRRPRSSPNCPATWPIAARATCGRRRTSDRPTNLCGRAGGAADLVLSAGHGVDLDAAGSGSSTSEGGSIDERLVAAIPGPASRSGRDPGGCWAWPSSPAWSITSTAAWSISRGGGRVLSLLLRGALVFLLILALGGLSLLRPTRELFVVFAVDLQRGASASRRHKAADDYVAEGGRARQLEGRFAVLPFAAAPGSLRDGPAAVKELEKAAATAKPSTPAAPVLAAGPPPEPADARGLDRKGTDLAAALEVAAAAVPPFYVPRIVLISDGNPTLGDALKTAAAMRGKVEVLTTSLPGRTEPEVQLWSVVNPGAGAPGRAVPGRGRGRQQPAADEARRIEVYRGDIKVADQPGEAQGRRGTGSQLKQTIDAGGLTPVTARLQAIQGCPAGQQQRLRAGLGVRTASRVCSCCGRAEPEQRQAAPTQRPQERRNIQVDVRPPRGAPANLAELQNYDLAGAPERAGDVAHPAQADGGVQRRTYVRGLVGRRADHAGYATSRSASRLAVMQVHAFEEIPPVRSDFEKGRRRSRRLADDADHRPGPARWSGEKIEMAIGGGARMRRAARTRRWCSGWCKHMFEETTSGSASCTRARTRGSFSTGSPALRSRRRHSTWPAAGGGL